MLKKIVWGSILVLGICLNAHAQQSGGDTLGDLENVCGLSGGTWHTSSSGWACCWADWGCYGCTNGSCLMNCHTKACRDANRMRKIQDKIIKEVAPKGRPAHVAPAPKKSPSTSKN